MVVEVTEHTALKAAIHPFLVQVLQLLHLPVAVVVQAADTPIAVILAKVVLVVQGAVVHMLVMTKVPQVVRVQEQLSKDTLVVMVHLMETKALAVVVVQLLWGHLK